MRTGRPPTPTPLRLLQGNPQHRPINDQEPKPKPIAPRCPSWLSPVAKRHWRELAPELERIGVLTTIDVGAFAGLCESWAQYRDASEFLHKHGAVYKTPKGGLARAPQVAIARDALAAYMRACTEFGLTAVARTRVKVRPAGEDDEDDLLDRPRSAKA